jgi:hypothetical protein
MSTADWSRRGPAAASHDRARETPVGHVPTGRTSSESRTIGGRGVRRDHHYHPSNRTQHPSDGTTPREQAHDHPREEKSRSGSNQQRPCSNASQPDAAFTGNNFTGNNFVLDGDVRWDVPNVGTLTGCPMAVRFESPFAEREFLRFRAHTGRIESAVAFIGIGIVSMLAAVFARLDTGMMIGYVASGVLFGGFGIAEYFLCVRAENDGDTSMEARHRRAAIHDWLQTIG